MATRTIMRTLALVLMAHMIMGPLPAMMLMVNVRLLMINSITRALALTLTRMLNALRLTLKARTFAPVVMITPMRISMPMLALRARACSCALLCSFALACHCACS